MNPLLLPVVAAQGLWVRSRTDALPAASGPTTGTVGDPAGQSVRVAVVGESTAAGCGVDAHAAGFAGSLAREVHARTGRPVEWEAVGRDGATIRRIRHRLVPRLGTGLSVAVLLAGVNDVLTGRSATDWGDDLGAVLDDLGSRAERTVVAGVPPFTAFPSLPALLGRYLAERAGRIDAASRRICAGRPAVTWIDSGAILPAGPGFFSTDRFHPSAAGYRRWAAVVAGRLDL